MKPRLRLALKYFPIFTTDLSNKKTGISFGACKRSVQCAWFLLGWLLMLAPVSLGSPAESPSGSIALQQEGLQESSKSDNEEPSVTGQSSAAANSPTSSTSSSERPEPALSTDLMEIQKILDDASKTNGPNVGVVENSVEEKVEPQKLFATFPYDHNVLPIEMQHLIRDPKADLKSIACGLIQRKKDFILRWEQKRTTSDEFPRSLDELEILCFLPEQYIDSVVTLGQRNIHQVGHSRGLCEKEVRAKAEDFMLGIHLEEKYDADPASAVHQLRPKYGFVNFFSPCGVKINPFRLFQYGQVIVVYADAVKNRTTYTYGDSLASYCEPLSMTMNPLDPLPLSLLRPPSETERNCRYVESQVWGPIELTDIKELRIPKERTDLAKNLANCGLPVFSYDRQKIEECYMYIDVSDCGWQRGEAINALAVELVKKERLAQR